MAHGLNLQGTCYNVGFFSMVWDWELRDQFVRRVFRQGQKSKTVIVHSFVARGTVDEVILKAQRSKDKTQRSLIQALKNSRTRK
jgi:SNF2 family DNA or RNA helicase